MPDKNVVDDYYSNIESSPEDKKKKPLSVKPKKVFKKVVKKKKVVETEKKVEKKEIPSQDTSKEVENPVEPKSKFQIISRAPAKIQGDGFQRGAKKFTPRKPYKGNAEKKPFTKRTPSSASSIGTKAGNNSYSRPQSKTQSGNQGGTKKRTEGGFRLLQNEEQGRVKTFGQNKQKASSHNNNYSGKKSHGLKPYNKGKRYKSDFLREDKPVTFARAKKSSTKKVEKNVEDIKQNLVVRTGETVVVGEILTLKELSEKLGVNLVQLIAEFMKNGMMVNINSKIDFDSASIIAEAFEVKLKKDDSAGVSITELMEGDMSELLKEDDDSDMVARPPVISIMGHVDHGKTSLLDYIRKSAVTTGEAGGITQSIGAYQVEKEGKKVTFLDTPGHEAFTVMRARGAKSTDIAILVVAADEGVKPQTIESISHAKEAGIPVVVAINKMDKEGANPDHIKGQLAEHGLTPEDWGGDTPMVPVSAITGFGIDELLEIVLLVAEMKELKANPNRRAIATVIESHLDLKLGPVATILINAGTIETGDNVVCKDSFGKIKVLKNYENKKVKKAFPGDPVLIVGLDKVVEGGDIIQAVRDTNKAREKAQEYKDVILTKKRNEVSGLEILMSKIKAGSLKQLKVVVKADTNGSLEALKAALNKLSTPEINVAVIHSGVGNITEGDVLMCSGSEAILIGFGVQVVPTAKKALSSSGIEFIDSKIIYYITERIEKIVTGMLDPKEVETILGTAKVGGIFYTSKEFLILGLVIPPDSVIENGAKLRVIRNKSKVGEGRIKSLKSGVEEVHRLEGPLECGIKFTGNVVPEMGDTLEIYKITIEKK